MISFLKDEKNGMSAQWGKLASEILLQNWDAALEDFKRLKEVIDGDVSFLSIFCSLISFPLLCRMLFYLFKPSSAVMRTSSCYCDSSQRSSTALVAWR